MPRPVRGDSGTWIELIRRALAHQRKPMAVGEIAERLNVSPNSAGKYVALGASAGILTVEVVGTTKRVSLAEEAASHAPARLPREDYLNRLFQGDCLEWMQHLPDRCIDMVLCDLPYGTTQNPWDSVVPLQRLWDEYRRVVKADGAIVLTSQGAFTARLILSNEPEFKYKIAWQKSKPTNFLNAKKQPLRKHEDVCVFYRRQPVYNPQMGRGVPYTKGVRKDQLSGSYGDFRPVLVESDGERYPTDVVYFKTAESEGEVWHPTQKPVALARYLVRTYTRPGDVVLDNTFGSGSFLVGAVAEGRNFIGIEKNEEMRQFKQKRMDYVELARTRVREAYAALDAATRKGVLPVNALAPEPS